MSVQMIVPASVPAQAAASDKQGASNEAGGEAPVFGKMLGAACGRHHHAHSRLDKTDPQATGEPAPHRAAGQHKHWRLLDALKAARSGKGEGEGEKPAADGDAADPTAEGAKPTDALGPVVATVVQVQQAPANRALAPQGAADAAGEEADAETGAIGGPGRKDEHRHVEARTGKQVVAAAEAGRPASGSDGAQQPQLADDGAKPASQSGEPRPHVGAIADGGQRPEPKVAATKEAAAEHPAARVTVVSAQVAPVPAASAPPVTLTPTGTALVDRLGAGDALPRHIEAAAALDPAEQSSGRPVTMLKIQLHPAYLGTVTAKLTGAGDHLAIEVQVDNHEARHRLQSDSDQIVKALRGMGYDIDRITVQQAPHAPATPGGADGRNGGGSFAAPDQRDGARQGQSFRQDTGQQQHEARNPASTGSDRGDGGGGVVI